MRTFLVTCLLLVARGVFAAEPTFDHGAVGGVIEENDLVVETDRHYTQGIKLFYFHADNFLPLGSKAISETIPTIGFESIVAKFGYTIGQSIYTPGDITNRMLQAKDRPYAGWLYIGAVLQRRGWSFGRKLTQEEFSVDAGVIGEWSLAEEAQTWVHESRNLDIPAGWRHELKNEPGLRFKYSRAVRLFEREAEGFGFDVTPHLGTSLGNVDTSLRAGGMVRVGYNLPDDFTFRTIDSVGTPSGGASVSNAICWSAYVFAGFEGRTALYNETLDGSLWHESHSVQRRWLVGDTYLGFAVILRKHCEVGYTHTFRSPEFRGQKEHDSFGAVYGAWRF
ncbi:MAG TPA: lipid A deacylase LpxR family protein [Candidatus Acidoferrum sp.]|nr:lipid A deacylase LpxR family protein [Candidatus Acidoferrum sp.]